MDPVPLQRFVTHATNGITTVAAKGISTISGNITGVLSSALGKIKAGGGISGLLSTTNSNKVIGLSFAIILLIVFSAIFSAIETAFSSANRIRLKSMENNGSKRAKKVLRQLDNFTKILNTALIGNNIINITASTLGALLFAEVIKNNAALSALVSTAVLTFAILMFAEIMPKSIAKDNAEKLAMFLQPILSVFIVVLTPLSWFFSLWRKIYRSKNKNTVTEDELITIVEEAESVGGINSHESALIRSAIEFDDVEVYDIMIPRVNMVMIRDTDSHESVASVFSKTGFSRLPVYHDSIDAILGILHEKDFYAFLREFNEEGGEGRTFMEKVKDNICLSRNMKISDALRTLQKAKVHMAVVVDEFGGTTGLVTMEDILEELVGEIYDEHDEEEVLFKQTGENEYVVSGAENLEDMFEQIGKTLKEEYDSTSVGGWVTEELQRIPAIDEVFEYENLTITIIKANTRKVIEIHVLKREVEDEDDEE